jgi:hypothetical protein
MVDNFELIMQLLSFSSEDDFYHLQVIKRKKEHPELGSNSHVVKTYYIRSLDHLDKVGPEIVSLCDFHGARAYINLNRRSFEKIAFHTLRKVTEQIMNRDFASVRKAYESVCGVYANAPEKRWILDLDGVETPSPIMMAFIDHRCEPIADSVTDGKCIAAVPTKNGVHLITRPFNLQKFREKYPEVDVHKDNPTLLYMP